MTDEPGAVTGASQAAAHPATTHSKIKVAVLFDGRGAEPAVSSASAAAIVRHLSRERYEVTPVRIDTDGRWTVGRDHAARTGPTPATLTDSTREPSSRRPTVLESMWTALHWLRQGVDVVFPAPRGGPGEDGTLQSTLDLVGIPYVGNGPLACAVGMDQHLTRKLLAEAGLLVSDGVEAAAAGRKVGVGVLEHPDGRVVAAPPLETAVLHAKAVEAFHVLGCTGLLRVDFFLPEVADARDPAPVVTEVNMMPGLTAMSPYPRIWSVAGLEYPALLDVLIDTALASRWSTQARLAGSRNDLLDASVNRDLT